MYVSIVYSFKEIMMCKLNMELNFKDGENVVKLKKKKTKPHHVT